MKRALVLGGIIAALATSAPAAAQTELGVTAGLFSSYVWRALTLTSGPVLQPDVSLTFPLGAASLTVGGRGNVEIGKYDDTDDVTQGGGSSFNLSEVDPYAELGFSAGKASIALGGVAYLFTNDDTAPANSSVNTVEVYGSVGIDALLSPSVSVYYDLDKVKGLYIEGGVSHGIPLGATTLSLGATGGFSNNMDPDVRLGFVSERAAADAYGVVFARDGTVDAAATAQQRAALASRHCHLKVAPHGAASGEYAHGRPYVQVHPSASTRAGLVECAPIEIVVTVGAPLRAWLKLNDGLPHDSVWIGAEGAAMIGVVPGGSVRLRSLALGHAVAPRIAAPQPAPASEVVSAGRRPCPPCEAWTSGSPARAPP